MNETLAETLRDAAGRLEFERALGGRFRYAGPAPAGAPESAAPAARAPAPTPEPVAPFAPAHAVELPMPVAEVPSPAVEAPVPVAGEAPAAPARPALPPAPPIAAPVDEALYERIAALVPVDSPLRAMTSLSEIGEWLERTVLVPIDAKRTRAVLGDGCETADLMVIGEAPGADEDQQGIPFVGRAGQLLDKVLEAVGFNRQNAYITNVVKSRPPRNRDPEPEEVAAHLPILHQQIAIVRPRLILVVGKVAAATLLGRREPMDRLRGVFHDLHGIPLMVTYHPAALLRNPAWKRPTWDDVRMLRGRYDEIAGASDHG